MGTEDHKGYVIAGDWGTSNLRLHLCHLRASINLTVIDTITGPGIGQITGSAESAFFHHVASWTQAYGKLPVVLSGMVGADIGWQETTYRSCPVSLTHLLDNANLFTAQGHDIAIIPGVSGHNPLGLPETMRGEELQLLGWFLTSGADGKQLICLPGTHSKWVVVEEGVVRHFITSITGELYKLLTGHSVLLQNSSAAITDDRAFNRGVEIAISSATQLSHTIFSVRSLQLNNQLKPDVAASYLSGLLIGSDVRGAVKLFQSDIDSDTPLVLIGEPALSQYYQRALQALHRQSDIVDGQTACLAGYQAAVRHFCLEPAL